MAVKVAVVTGAASGMGKSMTARLRDAGWAVAAVDLPGPGLRYAVAAETGVTPYPCDVSDDRPGDRHCRIDLVTTWARSIGW